MTFGDLRNRLARHLGLQALGDDLLFSAWGPDALNDAQRELAVELQVPRFTEVVVSAGSIVTPSRPMQTWGLLSAYNETEGVPLAIVSQARLPSLGYGYTVSRFVAYEPSSTQLELYPAPTINLSVRLHYAVVPTDMVNASDEPFNGAYQEFHHIVALRAAMIILEGDGGDDASLEAVTKRYFYELDRFRRRVSEMNHPHPRSEVNLDDAR